MAIRLLVASFTYRDLPDADKLYEAFGGEMGWVARALATGHGFSSPFWPWSGPTALEPPFYPFLLSLVFRIFGLYSLTSAFVILALNSLFSALTCIPVYFSAKYALGLRGAKVAAWIWAFYPFSIYFAACRVWEYALSSLLFATVFCLAQRIHGSARPWAWIGWGALWGVAAHSNASILATFPFLLGFALYRARREGRLRVTNGLLTVVAFLVVIAPWTVRNYVKMGIVCPMRDNLWTELYVDNFGEALYDTTSPQTSVNRPYPANKADEMRKYLSKGEVAYIAEKRALALDELRNRPHYGFWIVKTLRRALFYWTGFWRWTPQELVDQPTTPYNIFQLVLVLIFMLAGLRRLWRESRTAAAPYLILLIFFPITYYLTHPFMDYRQPIEPAVVVLMASGVLAFFCGKRRQKTV